jgi:hypothetical protein
MFAMVDADGNEYLRANVSGAPNLEAAESAKHGRMPYWAIPLEVAGTRKTWWRGRPVPPL